MNYIEVINEYEKNVEELEILKDFINYAASNLGLKNVMFNVIIINDNTIHKINKEYRNIDRPTDVITFALEDNKMIETPEVRVLGDIYISYDKVKSQAKEYNHSTKREICFLAVHGLLHLLGYDHMTKEDEEKMFGLQKELLEGYGIKKES
ncbi:MAG TPA: rRNA maturation RNase YbeY [Candidatus Aphodocola excrementigallinarum]|uniref:Endoribonuclease YbeY n=1 Tax=Candidatus Aphodocola excrementigallinarum TaxID=2840670 RepID=A0A9D1IRL7_9FIRM|nr:rRNA maturation RNase YbeY [Candidatus Aphodocola excrementigallinarum]